MKTFDEAALRADILAIAELERARKSRAAYEAHLDLQADKAAWEDDFYGMAEERRRHP